MEHYQRGEVVTRELHLLSDLKLEENVIHMKVQGHSRMHSLLSFAMNKINQAEISQIVWHGEGLALSKAMNCADIMKRKCKNLCMLSRKGVKRIEEYWEPIESESGLDRLRVNRDTDAVCILLSKLPLNAFKQEEGYLGVEDTPMIKSIPKAKPSSQSASNGRKTPANKPKYHSHKAKQKPL